ncbi:MAG: polysaccharide biosynthesis C-terminal domain-containing protein, partial [Bacteroidota bacterium]
SFGYHLAELPMFLVLGVKQLWNPIFYENMNKGDFKTISKLINYFVAFLTLINIGVLLFSKEAIVLFINPRYFDAIPVIGVIIVGVYFNGLLTISNSILAYKKKFGTTSKIALIATVICIVLNILLIPTTGIMGSAIATMISYFIYFVLGLWHQRETIAQLQAKALTIVPITCVVLVMLINLSFNHTFKNEFNWTELILKIIIFLAVCFTFYQFKLLGKEEVVYLKAIIKSKILKKKKTNL